jgi:hypothetical protein
VTNLTPSGMTFARTACGSTSMLDRAAVSLRTSFAGTRFNVWLPRMIADGERLDAVGK